MEKLFGIPYATKYSGEVRIFKDKIEFGELNDNNIELSTIFEKLFKNLYNINGYMPFNLIYVFTHPTKIETKSYFNVHMHI